MKYQRPMLAVIAGAMSAFLAWGDPDVSYSANTTVTEPLVLTGEYVVEVASNVTVVYSGEISGTGPLHIIGGGMLVLSHEGGNSFTEGVQISQGYVRADTAGSLGTGEVFLDGTITFKVSKSQSYCHEAGAVQR